MKQKIVVGCSNFGLGPVGKLSNFIEEYKDEYEWYACGEKFDLNVFNNCFYIDACWSLNEAELKEFIDRYEIKYALIVLKNKLARILKNIGVKVIYVDSLPFMWTEKDAKNGKVPYDVDAYCAQKTLPLNNGNKEIFKKVKNLYWINPIIKNNKNIRKINNENDIIINIGGLHSPTSDGIEYIGMVLIPLIETLKQIYLKNKIIITTGTQTKELLKNKMDNYKNVNVETYKQNEFLERVKSSYLFMTAPGLTTICEVINMKKPVILLPPENLSQFYNIKFAQKKLYKYKILKWNIKEMNLSNLRNENSLESEIIDKMINCLKSNFNEQYIKKQKDYFIKKLGKEYKVNNNYQYIESGTNEINYLINKFLKGGQDE